MPQGLLKDAFLVDATSGDAVNHIDEAFARGIELYDRGEYAKACRLFMLVIHELTPTLETRKRK